QGPQATPSRPPVASFRHPAPAGLSQKQSSSPPPPELFAPPRPTFELIVPASAVKAIVGVIADKAIVAVAADRVLDEAGTHRDRLARDRRIAAAGDKIDRRVAGDGRSVERISGRTRERVPPGQTTEPTDVVRVDVSGIARIRRSVGRQSGVRKGAARRRAVVRDVKRPGSVRALAEELATCEGPGLGERYGLPLLRVAAAFPDLGH